MKAGDIKLFRRVTLSTSQTYQYIKQCPAYLTDTQVWYTMSEVVVPACSGIHCWSRAWQMALIAIMCIAGPAGLAQKVLHLTRHDSYKCV